MRQVRFIIISTTIVVAFLGVVTSSTTNAQVTNGQRPVGGSPTCPPDCYFLPQTMTLMTSLNSTASQWLLYSDTFATHLQN
jgi:hypothetical protein